MSYAIFFNISRSDNRGIKLNKVYCKANSGRCIYVISYKKERSLVCRAGVIDLHFTNSVGCYNLT